MLYLMKKKAIAASICVGIMMTFLGFYTFYSLFSDVDVEPTGLRTFLGVVSYITNPVLSVFAWLDGLEPKRVPISDTLYYASPCLSGLLWGVVTLAVLCILNQRRGTTIR